eukprot:TRINITY_DN14937_c0_g1_i1.p1 TRINITY_DN14937_c0_g1~~TRINITY_DN14937_c0_g1_i1.p1  ORF type:complete len:214 (+),score=24.52 TRINITY_DN14937_c0_g1_i1:68-709(+)
MGIRETTETESGQEYRERILDRGSSLPLLEKCPYLDYSSSSVQGRRIISISGNGRNHLLRRILIDLTPPEENNEAYELLFMINSKTFRPQSLPISSSGVHLLIPCDRKDRYYCGLGLPDLLMANERICGLIFEGLGGNAIRHDYTVRLSSLLARLQFSASIPVIYTLEEDDEDSDVLHGITRIVAKLASEDRNAINLHIVGPDGKNLLRTLSL